MGKEKTTILWLFTHDPIGVDDPKGKETFPELTGKNTKVSRNEMSMGSPRTAVDNWILKHQNNAVCKLKRTCVSLKGSIFGVTVFKTININKNSNVLC